MRRKHKLIEVPVDERPTFQFKAKTDKQAEYIRAIHENVITFGEGAAGSGKTFVPVAIAASMLQQGSIDRIIITRPVIESGEHLGYLPGTFEEKTRPYLRPIFDAFQTAKLSHSDVTTMLNSKKIEISPLAYMRGVTFTKSFMILDEAQNASVSQMELFLTRIGEGTKVVVTGDLMQSDLNADNGLSFYITEADSTSGITAVRFREVDTVRHPIVAKIIEITRQKKERLRAEYNGNGRLSDVRQRSNGHKRRL